MSETEKLLGDVRKFISQYAIHALPDAPCPTCDMLSRIDAHLAKRDVVEVPVKPSRVMCKAGAHIIAGNAAQLGASWDTAGNVYRAMLRAAQERK